MSFILIKNKYAKKSLEIPESAILGLFWQIDSTKRPNVGFLDTLEPPKSYKSGHFIGTVIIWGFWGV